MYDRRELTLEMTPAGTPVHRTPGIPMSVDVPAMQDESVARSRSRVMDAVIAAYGRSGNRAAFQYHDDGEYITVVPSAVAGTDGVSRPFESILTVPVTVQLGQYTLRQVLGTILTQVGNRIGTNISLGAVPNSFSQVTVTEEAANEPARDVIVRLFYEQNGQGYRAGVPPERLYWQITYMAEWQLYFFNVDVVPSDLSDAEIAKRSRDGQPAASVNHSAVPVKAVFVTPN